MQRRDYLKAIISAAAIAPAMSIKSVFAQTDAQAYTTDGEPVPTILWVSRGNIESTIDYSTDQGMRAISWMLRDTQANVVGTPHVRLLQLLSWMQAWLAGNGYHTRLDFHSGLRMPSTNDHTEGAEKRSYHLPQADMVFRAADFSTKTVPSNYLGELAKYAAQGGVGFYPTDNFIHTDTGPTGRTWTVKGHSGRRK